MGQVLDRVTAILLDIEGTTTPVDYVFGVLFPFAQTQMQTFLRIQGHTPEVQADIDLLRQDHGADIAQGLEVPPWSNAEPEAALPYIQTLMAADRKTTGLKSLQGKIWDQGYRDGTLQSQIFPDVAPALRAWVEAGKTSYIFSSGSVQAQQSLFRYTEAGDLTPLIQGYFDTRTGPKQEMDSYRFIAGAIATPPHQILFISDVVAELTAAQGAGMAVYLSVRPGNAPTDPQGLPVITTFNEIQWPAV